MKGKSRVYAILSVFIAAVLGLMVTACAQTAKTTVTLSDTTLSLTEGQSAALTATVNDKTAVSWSSDKPEVADYKNGKVEAYSAGTAVITATAGTATATCTVTVTAATVEKEVKLTLNRTTLSLEVGKSGSLTATARLDLDVTTEGTVSWASDKPDIVSVTPDGTRKVTLAALKAGTAKITASYEGKEASATVTVTQLYDIDGVLSVDNSIDVGSELNLSTALFTNTVTGDEFEAEVGDDGAYSKRLPVGEYTLTLSHPSYSDIVTTVEVKDANITLPSLSFAHYGYGGQINPSTWAYDKTDKTLSMERGTGSDGQMSQYYLLNTASTQNILTATINASGEKFNKIGLIFAGTGNATAVGGKYSVMLSPAQAASVSQIQILSGNGGLTADSLTYSLYNDALMNITGGTIRFNVPHSVLTTEEAFDGSDAAASKVYTMKEVKLTLIRDNADMYILLDDVLYVKVTIAALNNVSGTIGFRNQNQKTAEFSDISYALGADAVAPFVNASVTVGAATNGSIAVTDLEDNAVGDSVPALSSVKVILTPASGYELDALYLGGVKVLSGITESEGVFYYTHELTALKENIAVSADFSLIPLKYAVTGKLSATITTGLTVDMTQATVTAKKTGALDVTAGVLADGSYSVSLTDGEYSLVFSHPSFGDETLSGVTVSGAAVGDKDAAFKHYAYGDTVTAGTWSYDEATSKLTVGRGTANGVGMVMLKNTATTQYVFSAKMNGSSGNTHKMGFVVAATGEVGYEEGKFNLVFSPSQNEMHIYDAMSEPDWARTYYNGAYASGKRVKLPGSVLSATAVEGVYAKELNVTVIRDNTDIYVLIDGVLYTKFVISALDGVEAGIGFKTQNFASLEYTNIAYDLSAAGVADALRDAVITAKAVQNGSIEIEGGAEATVPTTAAKLSTVTVKLIPASGYELDAFYLNTVRITSNIVSVNDGEYYTYAHTFTDLKQDLHIEVTFKAIVYKYNITGTLSASIGTGAAADLTQAKVIASQPDAIDIVVNASQNGEYLINLAEGTYTLTFAHPSFSSVVTEDFVVSGADQANVNATFAHYGYGNQINPSTWVYDKTEKTLTVERASAQGDDALSQYYLLNTASTQSVFTATINAKGPNTSKMGLVFAGIGDVAAVANKYSVIFSPTQNQIHIFNANGEIAINTNYSYAVYNGASRSGTSQRFNLPAGVLATTGVEDDLYTLKEIKLTVVRDNDTLYILIDDVLYLRAVIPAIRNAQGALGFRNQNQKTLVFSDISYGLGADAVNEFLNQVEIRTTTDENVDFTFENVNGEGYAALGDYVRVNATGKNGKKVTGIAVTDASGTAVTTYNTGAGVMFGNLAGGFYTVTATTADEAGLVSYAGKVTLPEAYRYHATNNTGTYAAHMPFTVAYFKSGLTANFGAIDNRELILKFTGTNSEGTYYAAIDGTYDGGYAFSVDLPAGTYDYTLADIELLGYHVVGTAGNIQHVGMDKVNRFDPISGNVTVAGGETDGLIQLSELAYGSRASYVDGKPYTYLVNTQVHTKHADGTRGVDGNFYVGTSELVAMMSFKAAYDKNVRVVFNGDGHAVDFIFNAGATAVTSSNATIFASTAAAAVTRNTSGFDDIVVIRQNGTVRFYVNGTLADVFVNANGNYNNFHLAFAVNCTNVKDLYTTTNTALIEAVING